MTCLLVLMVLRAMVVICSDCCIQSLATSFITMRLLYMMRKGVASIDSTMAARIGFISAGCTSPFSWVSDSSTKPNSPACARNSPERSATPVVAPISRASTRMMTALTSSGTASSASTSAQRSTRMCQSSIMPMVMKNSPSSTSWKGRMSVPTWWRYSVSDTSTPAMNAPSARLRPASSVSQARPRVMSSRFSMNSSSLLRRATRVSHQRMKRCPPVSNSPTRTTALMSAQPSAGSNCSDAEPRAGIKISSGTTAKSWNSRMPITLRPCSLSSSARSAISLTTMAVLLMASTPDSASAVCQPMSQMPPTQCDNATPPTVTTAMVASTCISPRPNTCLRMASSLGRLNSSPMANIKNTTPNSPRWRTPSEFCASAMAWGPISTPAAR